MTYTLSTVANLASLSNPFPVGTFDSLPYNFRSTPFFGDATNSVDLETAQVSYTQNGTLVTKSWTSFLAQMQEAVTEGVGRGKSSEVISSFLAQRWQEFFYIFQPLVTNEIFKQVRDDVESNGSSMANYDYFTGLFERCFTNWMNYRSGTSPGDLNGDSLIAYLNSTQLPPQMTPPISISDEPPLENNMRYRQRNVIMWQLYRIVGMIHKLNTRTINAGARSTLWNQVDIKALNLMATTSIPALTGSSEEFSIPDPSSLSDQNAAVILIEGYRGKHKTAEQTAQIQDSAMSFSGETVAQQRQALVSFWGSLSNIMDSILNS